MPGPAGIAGAVFGWLLLALAALDIAEFWLPDPLTLTLALAGFAAGLVGIDPPLTDRLIGGAAGFGSLWLIGFSYKRLRGREGLGGGDPKLLGAIGLWLGWRMLPAVLLLAAMTGLALVLLGMLTRPRREARRPRAVRCAAGDRSLPGMVVPVRKCAMKARIVLPLLLIANSAPAAQKSAPPPPAAPQRSVDGLPIGEIPKQTLPAKGCAAFLWSAAGTPRPGRDGDGRSRAASRVARRYDHGSASHRAAGPGGFGFSGVTEYRGGAVTAVLDMTITIRNDLKDGASVPQATLRIDREGQDSVVLPVAGLIGCV